MKRLLVGLVLVCMSLVGFSQVKFIFEKDEMNGKTYKLPSENLIIANEAKNKGFVIQTTVGNNGFTLISTLVGCGSCSENDKMIVLFENGDKVELVSWNEFNCDCTGYFEIKGSTLTKLKTIPISKIRITNGRTYESYTGEPKNKNYFVELLNSPTEKI